MPYIVQWGSQKESRKIQLDKSGVRRKLGQEVNRALIEEIKLDVVITATGGTLAIRRYPVSIIERWSPSPPCTVR
jgi:hypothetical protein